MPIVILCNEAQKQELGQPDEGKVIFLRTLGEMLHHKEADAFIDLLFEPDDDRIQFLQQLLPGVVIVHSVEATLTELHPLFVRVNAWPGFLTGTLVEASSRNEERKAIAEQAFSCFRKQLAWLPDEPGFVTPRVISAIVNEAYYALAEGVASREDMDTALKLGTAYPYGPFEWAQKIGLNRIARLLQRLAETESRYTPAPLLVQEAQQPSAVSNPS